MRTALWCLAAVFVVGSTGLTATHMNEPPGERRAQAVKLLSDNNFNEALTIFETLLRDADVTDRELGSDLQNAINCLNNLSRIEEADQLIEDALSVHPESFPLVYQAGQLYQGGLESYGFVIGGAFERGTHRGGGQMASVEDRDRVRSLQLLLKALELAEKDSKVANNEKADVWHRIASAIGSRRHSESWRLQELTDFATLPPHDISESRLQFRWGMVVPDKGAPVDSEGNPVLHRMPESWAAATTDGERWRFALSQVHRYNEERRSEIDLEWASFLQAQFGVSSGLIGGPPVIRPSDDNAREPDAPKPSGVWTAHELTDEETIARLATGVRRFKLPEEFNHVAILKTVIARKDASLRQAQDALINERMNRHQYDQAAELLKQVLSAARGDDRTQIQRRIDQILKNWVQFESVRLQPAGAGGSFDVRFRNGSQISFEARPIRIDQLLTEIRRYIESKPQQIDWQQTHLDNIGWTLLHRDPSKYLDPAVARWQLDVTPAEHHFDSTVTVASPLQKAGAYWVTAKMKNGNDARMVLWIADTAITRKRVEEGTMYFVADAVSGAPIARADLEFFGWRQEYQGDQRFLTMTSRFADRTDENGFCIPSEDDLINQNQWIVIARTKDGRFAFDGFNGVWNPEKLQPLNYSPLKVYAITDRPVYRPGHTVKYRLWARTPRFEGEDNSYADREVWVQIRNPKGDVSWEGKAKADRWGGVDGEWLIPTDETLGTFQLSLAEEQQTVRQVEENGTVRTVTEMQRFPIGGGSFVVEEYRKPEFEVTVEAPERPVKLGEKIQARIIAKYYFGAPVTEAKVHYKVERTRKDGRWYPVAQWDWLYSPGYWWFAPDYDWYPGFKRWGCLAPVRPWWNWSPDPPEVVAEGDGVPGPDGVLLVDFDTAAALANHSDSDHQYSITAEVTDRSRRTIIGNGSVLVARDPFQVFVWTDRGHYQTGDDARISFQARTPDGKPVVGKGRVTLSSVAYPGGDDPIETEIQSWDTETDATGNGSLRVSLPASGQFRLSVRITDSEAHEQEGGYVLYVRGPNQEGNDFRFNDLELIPDQREYRPGETVRLQINTNRTDSTVLLFIRPMYGLCPKPQVLHIRGKSTVVDVPITQADMPNIFVEAVTIANGRIFNEIREIVVPPEQRVANVEVLPGAEKYRPGEEAVVRVKLTDIEGRPFVGTTVLSAYDASLEYVAASSIPEIRSFFWNVRRYHHLQLASTLQRQCDPVYRENEIAMEALFAPAPGMDLYGGGGGGRFGMMGGFGGGGPLGRAGMRMNKADLAEGMAMPMAAPAADMVMDAKAADGGGGNAGNSNAAPALRSNFADTAHWVASVTTDEQGFAEIRFRVPDNLTTWKVKVWTLGDGTRVGSGSSDLISSKNLIIRPQTPRFFTERDQMVLSGVVHNYLTSEKTVRVALELEGGQLRALDEPARSITIPAGGEARVDWTVDVIASGLTKIRMNALTDEESDAVQIQIPVHTHGILKTESYTSVIRPDQDSSKFVIRVPEDRIPEKSRLEIRYSPSLAGAMVDSLPYLIRYPYGCTEQTLNRFLPAVLTQKTLQRMGVNLADIRKHRISLDAQRTYRGKFPAHWGEQPAIQTKDHRELPAGFGFGSTTLANWIQEHIDADAGTMLGQSADFNPVFDDQAMNTIVRDGVKRLTEMQLSDGGWGWFSGYGEYSSPHLTALVVHGLTIAQQNDVPILPDVQDRGVEWLKNYQQSELRKLQEGDKRRNNDKYTSNREYRMSAGETDALVAQVLSEHGQSDPAMSDYLYRDRGALSAYGLALTGLILHQQEDADRRDMVIRNIEQFLVQDEENQTAWLNLPENSYWYWYGNDNEAMSVYLKLLIAVHPESETAPRLVKYLLNNRKHSTYWNSTRDTAMVVEAMAEYIRATGEDQPDMTIEVLVDGQVQKTVKVSGENLFSYDNMLVIEGDAVTSGEHTVEIRRSGHGPVYMSAWLTNFTKEDAIRAAGLEVKVERKFYRLERDDRSVSVQGNRGQVVGQQVAQFRRIPLENLQSVKSGELIEVEMLIESKNDYEYLLLEDRKPSGFEPDDQRSGYIFEGLRAYRELRDDKVSFFVQTLARGRHSVSYRLRAETPGSMNALPATIEGMYSPELVGNSDEFSLKVQDGE